MSKSYVVYVIYIFAQQRVNCVSVLYDVRYAQGTTPDFSCQSCLDLYTTFSRRFHDVFLNASARPFEAVLYINDLCR